jgi:hypothetical protein
MVGGEFLGVKEVQATLSKITAKMDMAMRLSAQRMGAEAEREIKKTILPTHNDGSIRSDGRTTDAEIGGPPMTRTGALRAGIKHSEPLRLGFADYVVQVGPTEIYGRAVELGAPNWQEGVKYPYVKIAAERLKESGKLYEIHKGVIDATLKW